MIYEFLPGAWRMNDILISINEREDGDEKLNYAVHKIFTADGKIFLMNGS